MAAAGKSLFFAFHAATETVAFFRVIDEATTIIGCHGLSTYSISIDTRDDSGDAMIFVDELILVLLVSFSEEVLMLGKESGTERFHIPLV